MLSGGGVRGAYEVGVVRGIVEVLGLKPTHTAPFTIFTGTSVGAINATFLAANAHRGDLASTQLARVWAELRIQEHLRVDPFGWWRWSRPKWFPFQRRRKKRPNRFGRSLLDPRPLDALVRDSIDWSQLHQNISSRNVQALILAALDISTGQTTMFGELAADCTFRPSRDPRRRAEFEPITANHVLASAAIPILFPARRIAESYYCDGGLRFNTPIAPAIRSGANRLVIVSVKHTPNEVPTIAATQNYPNPVFLLGKLLNALLLDPVSYDLQVLERFNQLIEALEASLSPEEMERIQQVLIETRGVPYRRLKTLVFMPSVDISAMAQHYVEHELPDSQLGTVTRWLIGKASESAKDTHGDIASFLLFDGSFAQRLIDLGRRDAQRRADEICTFFG